MSFEDPQRPPAARGTSHAARGASQAARGASHAVGLIGRLARAWRVLPSDRRLAAGASLGLFVTLFLPWYQREYFVVIPGRAPQQASDSLTAWGAFSFVEAAVLVVAVGVLTLLFRRAEGRAFHLPGGDGWVITIAGVWTCILIIWRIFDKQGATSHTQAITSYGIEWGIFIALADAGLLTYAGSRVRAARQPEPPLPGARPDGPGGGPDGRGAGSDHRRAPSWGPSGWDPPEPGSTRPSSAPRRTRAASPSRPAAPRQRPDPFAPFDQGSVNEPPELETRVIRRRPPMPPDDTDPTRVAPPNAPRRHADEQLTIPLEDSGTP